MGYITYILAHSLDLDENFQSFSSRFWYYPMFTNDELLTIHIFFTLI